VVVDRLEVLYCEGWDPQARTAVGPVARARAAERDRAGEQYAVALAVSGRPLAIIEVAWRDVYCSVWFLDEQLRRAFQVDCRRLAEGRLFVAGGRQWAYTEAAQAEFDEHVTWGEFEISLDGRRGGAVHVGSATPMTLLDRMVEPEDYWLDAPEFGDWGRFIRAFPGHLAALGHEISPAVLIDDVSDPVGEGLPAGMRPWHPPRPLQPAHLDLLFSAGMRLVVGAREPIPGVGGTVIVEVQTAGTLRMPSGGLIACDPTWVYVIEQALPGTYADDHRPFTAAVAPGEYPLLLSLFRWVDDARGPDVAAAKVAVRNEPVASWEMGLRPGQDLRILGDGGFFGFGVDRGTACFFDAIAAPAMARLTRDFVLGYTTTAELSDPESGANLIAFHSGWGDGSYPTWVGRTASGDVACFIADMLLFDNVVPDPGTNPAGE
jgi:Protein of unknown function (DUF4241)